MLVKVTNVKLKEVITQAGCEKVEGIQLFITELHFSLKDCYKWEEKLLNVHT